MNASQLTLAFAAAFAMRYALLYTAFAFFASGFT